MKLRVKGIFRIILLLTLLVPAGQGFAENQEEYQNSRLERKRFDRDRWDDLRDDLNYEGEVKKRNKPNSELEGGSRRDAGGSGSGSGGSGSGGGNGNNRVPESSSSDTSMTIEGPNIGPFMNTLLIILVIVLLAVLIYFLFANAPIQGSSTEVDLEDEELDATEIPKSELELMLERALAKRDYRKAVRIYFIFIIKELAERSWINWERKKTNLAYLLEMRSRPEHDQFNEIVNIFELVWYGDRKLDDDTYREVEPHFKNFMNNIGMQL